MQKKLKAENKSGRIPLLLELKKTNPALFKLFYSSPVAKALLFLKTNKYIEVNREFLKLFECKRKDVIGNTPDELGFWANTSQRKKILHDYIKDKKGSFNFDIKTHKGKIKNVIVSSDIIEINGDNYLLGNIQDVTDIYKYELKFKESEDQYKLLFYKNPQPMWIFDFDSLRFISVNDAAIKHYGYSKSEFLGMKLTDIRPKNEIKKYAEYRDRIIRKKTQNRSYNAGIWKHKKKNGEIIDVEITRTVVKYNGKNAILILANDVTKLLRSEQKLKYKNEEIKLLYNANKEITSTLDPNEIYEKTYKTIKKYIKADVMTISSYNRKDKKISCLASWHKGIKQDPAIFPILPLEPKGKGIQSRIIREGKPRIINDYDIAVQKSINRYYFKKDGTFDKKPKKGIRANRSAMMVPMKLESKVIGVISIFSYKNDAFTPDDLQLVEALSTQLSASTANAHLFQQAQNELAERKKAEEALNAKKEELQILYDSQLVLSGSLDIDSIYDKTYHIIVSNIKCDSMIISSYNSKDNMIRILSLWADGQKPDINIFLPIPLAPEGKGIQSEVIRTGRPLLINDYPSYYKRTQTRYSYRNDKLIKRAKLKYFSALIVPMMHEGKIIGVIQLLSYTKNAYNETDLKLLESLSGPIAAATYNASLYKQAKIEIEEKQKAREELALRNKEITLLYRAGRELLSTLVLEEIYEIFYRKVIEVVSCDSMIIAEYDRKNEKIICKAAWVENTKHDHTGFPLLNVGPDYIGTQAEAIVTGNSVIVNNFYDVIKNRKDKFLLDDSGKLLNSSESEQLVDDDTLISRSALYIPMKLGRNVIGVISVFSFKENAYSEYDLKILESISVNLSVAAANAELYNRSQKEIVERIKKEEELKQIRKNLEEAQRIAHIGSWVYDIRVNKLYNSGELYRILGYKEDPESFEFDEAMEHIHTEDRMNTIEKLKNAVALKCKYENEDRIVRPDGEIRDVKIVGEPMFDENGKYIGIQGTLQDITEVKRINEELVRSLSEKELMLKEIHHRVKNNLQIVSSLLRLQAEKITDKSAIEHFRLSEQRIKSMALIHQQLYKTKDLSRINFREYLYELCSYLMFANATSQRKITFTIEAEELYFGIDTALPCGLIINELFTNSIKHAFPNAECGSIIVKFGKEPADKYLLVIKDNGIGAVNLDLEKTTSLGMELVNTLTQQLEGEISLHVDNGTEIKIIFKDQKQH